MNYDLFDYALRNMRRRKLRTFLTLVAIIIGISAFVGLITIGDSFKKTVDDQLAAFGKETIIVYPGSLQSLAAGGSQSFASKGALYERDVEALKSTNGIESAVPIITVLTSTTQYHNQQMTIPMFGVKDTQFFDWFSGYTLDRGRGIYPSDKKVAIIGYAVANTLFDSKVDVGSTLIINGERFKVVGVLTHIGGSFESNDDFSMYIPYSDARRFSKDTMLEDEVSFIFLKTRSGQNVTQVVSQVENTLRSSHHENKGEEDFSVISADFIVESAGIILSAILIAVALISGVSLVVGSIVVMNTMFMSVTERTREIGTLKAIGARNSHIFTIVLLESGLLGLVGGIIGMVIGLCLGALVTLFGLQMSLNPVIIIGSVLLSFALGLVAGYLPARRAVKLSPVEALRYE